MKCFLASTAILAVAFLAGCQARKEYPLPAVGSHSPSFDVVFGRLAVVAQANPDADPVWIVRFGTYQDPYQGQLALEPPGRPLGFSANDLVQVRGRILPAAGAPVGDAFNGRHYAVQSIQLWGDQR